MRELEIKKVNIASTEEVAIILSDAAKYLNGSLGFLGLGYEYRFLLGLIEALTAADSHLDVKSKAMKEEIMKAKNLKFPGGKPPDDA